MKKPTTDNARRGFTLIELIAVIGLMAMLGTVATAGYRAATRGMTYTGIANDVEALVKSAEQTSFIENVPTAVIFYNEPVSAATGAAESGENFRGVAMAVKMAGRLSGVQDGVLLDEYAGWEHSYPKSGNFDDAGMRFFKMDLISGNANLDSCSTLVEPYLVKVDASKNGDYFAGMRLELGKVAEKLKMDENTFKARWGLKRRGGVGDWKPGDAYGMEMGMVALPAGYWFGNSAPSGDKRVGADAIKFVPDPNRGPAANTGTKTIRVNGREDVKVASY